MRSLFKGAKNVFLSRSVQPGFGFIPRITGIVFIEEFGYASGQSVYFLEQTVKKLAFICNNCESKSTDMS